MLNNIQFLRFLAAAAVVYYHTGFGIGGIETEFGAVLVFFCISGFIMTMITRDEANDFLLRRVVRVVPLYWIVTLCYWALITLPGGRKSTLASLSTYELPQSLFFIPYRNVAGHMQPVLNVGWTLNYEMYFYVVFGLCLLINRRAAPLLCAAVICLVAFVLSFLPGDLASFYSDQHVLYFVGGIGIYYLAQAIPSSTLLTVAAALAALSYPLALTFLPRSIGMFMPGALVLGVVILERAGLKLSLKSVALLGAASYAIYLSHFLILHSYRIYIVPFGFPAFESALAASALVTLASVLLGVVMRICLEKPLTQWLNDLVARFRRLPAAVSVT